MSITDKNKVDFISTRDATGDVILTISDHLDWEDASSHILMLQDKLNLYIHFIESRQIISEYPQSQGKNVVIEIVSKYPYEDIGLQLITKAKSVLESMNVDLRYIVG